MTLRGFESRFGDSAKRGEVTDTSGDGNLEKYMNMGGLTLDFNLMDCDDETGRFGVWGKFGNGLGGGV